MTPLEWILSVALLLSGGGNFKQHMDLRKASNEIVAHAEQEQKTAQQLEQSMAQLKEVRAALDAKVLEIEEVQTKADEKQKEIESQVSLDMSIAYEQAKDIYSEHESPFTEQHLKTLQLFLENWDYDAMAGVIKWNMDVIKQQQQKLSQIKAERDQLHAEREQFRTERDDLRVKHASISGKHEELVKHNTHLGNHGQTLAEKLDAKVKEVTGFQGMIANYLWMVKVAVACGILFFLYNIYQWFQGRHINQVREVAQRELVKRNTILKEFFRTNDDGNDTLMKILEEEDIDLEENGNGGSKKALKAKNKADEEAEMKAFRQWQRQQLKSK